MPEDRSTFTPRDYSLTGPEARRAAENGLVSATWYQSPVPRKRLKELMQRSDGPALRDTAIWFLSLGLSAGGAVWLWGSWGCVPFLLVYGVLYGSASNARWHECGHGTAFKTRWMNDAVYQIASFMTLFEPHVWRWSHARHHTDTVIVGRDPEIVEPRPPQLGKMLLNLTQIPHAWNTLGSLWRHAQGRMTDAEQTFIPESEWPKVTFTARIWLTIFAATVMSAAVLGSWLPVLLIGTPLLYGGWLSYLFGVSQHVGLAEDSLDHRSNCRTIYMNPVLRFLYLNMNYHLEHHMYPMVPYHALPKLHEAMRDDCPVPYPSLFAAYREIVPTLWRQRRDPEYFVHRVTPQRQASPDTAHAVTG
ncbi:MULTISPECIES: fatty acid desaturase family protein [Pseudomonas]|uniref:fatty acid desaturase family protein n=1 Tax=Pseudomonas TaxID=286 RepID=UPI001CFAEF39|nr:MULTISPECIES: fatty acid desaturase family protein [Pseudomonas]